MDSTHEMSQNIAVMIPRMSTLQSIMIDPDMQAAWLILIAAGIGVLFLMLQYRSFRRRLRKRNAYRVAIRLLDRMIEVDPSNAMAVWQKGEVYEAMGMHDRALRLYQTAHNMSPRAYAYRDLSDAHDRIKANLKFKHVLRTPSLN